MSGLDFDIDDILNDIGDDKPAKTSAFGMPSTAVKKTASFDDFYDEEPVSEANVDDIVKSVDSEKMDNNLFNKKDSNPLLQSNDFGSTVGSDMTVIEKPSSAPGPRTTSQPAKSQGFDDFDLDSLLPDENPKKPGSAPYTSTSKKDTSPMSSSLPLPAQPPSDTGSSGGYMPSMGPSRSTFGGKSVSFADERPPTRVGKSKVDSELGENDWLELAGGGSSSSLGRSSVLDDILSGTSTSRRPGTTQPASQAATSKADNTKPKSAPGDLDGLANRASQSRGPPAGSTYGMMLTERDESSPDKQKSAAVSSTIEDKNDKEFIADTIKAPSPPRSLTNFATVGGSSASVTGSTSSLVTSDAKLGSPAAPRSSGRPLAGSSILLDPSTDLFGPSGEFNPLRSRKTEAVDSPVSVPVQSVNNPTPPGTANVIPGVTALPGSTGVDENTVSEITRLVELHNRESQLSTELTAVRRHMDVNKLYLQRLLSSVFGLGTQLPPGAEQSSTGKAEETNVTPSPVQRTPSDTAKIKELEGEVERLQVQIQFLENMKTTIQTQHEQELEVIRKSYQRQIDETDYAFHHKEERLKSNLIDATNESEAAKKRHADELAEKDLFHKSEIERMARERDDHIRQMSNQHRQEMAELRRAHEEQVHLLRAERRADAAAAGAAPELKQLADHLAELESNVQQRHENSMSLKMVMFNDREANFRSQEAALVKEREQIRQALNQLEQARGELQQQRWAIEQKEAKLNVMQSSLEEERRRLAESAERDRSHLDKMRSDMMEEHGKLLQDIFKERQKIGQEAEKVESEHRRLLVEKGDIQQQQMINQQTIAQARQAEERMQNESSKMLTERERFLVELRQLDEERTKFSQIKAELDENRRKVEEKMSESASMVTKGSEDLAQAQALRNEIVALKQQISEKQAAITNAQGAIENEKSKLERDRADFDQLRRVVVCSSCSKPVSQFEVNRTVLQTSPQFASIQDQLKSLEQNLTEDLRSTVPERDTNSKSKQKQKQKRRVRIEADEFDYETERAWLSEVRRNRISQNYHF